MHIKTRLWNYLLAGVLVTAPLGITLWLAWEMVGLIDEMIDPLVPPRWELGRYLPFHVPGYGILIVLTALMLIGALARGVVGRGLVRGTEWVLRRIPIVSSLYGWTQQILETLLSDESTAFREVVLIEYPYRGCWAIGFVTGQTTGEIQALTDATVFNVFVPATPNPTTGFLLFLPKQDIHTLELTVDEGMKLVISGGIVKPSRPMVPSSTLGEGTTVAEEIERIKLELEAERAAAKERAIWGTDSVFGDEVRRIKEDWAASHPYEYKPPSVLGTLRDHLFTGILITAPFAITIWLCVKVITYVDSSVLPLLPDSWNPAAYLPFAIPGLGLVLALAILIVTGFFAASFLGESLVRTSERVMQGLPVLRGVYSALKQLFETMLKSQSEAFREVALVEYPRPECWAIGFITGEAAEEVREQGPSDSVNVFLPTTPNPTSGFLVFLPRSSVRRLSMSVEEGLKMVVSGGIVAPKGAPVQPASTGELEHTGR